MVRLGIDLGGTNIAVGVVNEQNEIIGTASVKTMAPRPAEEIADSMREACLLALGEARMTLDDVASVGVGTPGAVNEEGVVEFSANLGFNDTPLRDLVAERLGKPTYIENDANCAALGEQIDGCGGGVPNFVAVTLGTGVGGGIILGGKIVAGSNGAAGEIGHMKVRENELETCGCGKKGCLEQYASATGVVRLAKRALTAAPADETPLRKLEEVSAKDVFDYAKSGDEFSLAIVDEVGKMLGEAIAHINCVVDPEVVVFGGGVSKAGQILLDAVEKYYKPAAFHAAREVDFKLAVLGNDAGMYGAVRMILAKGSRLAPGPEPLQSAIQRAVLRSSSFFVRSAGAHLVLTRKCPPRPTVNRVFIPPDQHILKKLVKTN